MDSLTWRNIGFGRTHIGIQHIHSRGVVVVTDLIHFGFHRFDGPDRRSNQFFFEKQMGVNMVYGQRIESR